ncbi:unnamed protein product [Mytilus coruscus]|uniref:Uncharacterized protein n=1 Tax=Mytilus coruscus TaxID=42192 RepID=A0A6J8E9L3_MYTCO|nr:unnamed protein product [Mytilus coruscus]
MRRYYTPMAHGNSKHDGEFKRTMLSVIDKVKDRVGSDDAKQVYRSMVCTEQEDGNMQGVANPRNNKQVDDNMQGVANPKKGKQVYRTMVCTEQVDGNMQGVDNPRSNRQAHINDDKHEMLNDTLLYVEDNDGSFDGNNGELDDTIPFVHIVEFEYRRGETGQIFLKDSNKKKKSQKTKNDTDLKNRILEGYNSGASLNRDTRQIKLWKKFSEKVVELFPQSEAVDELHIKCGTCKQTFKVNRLRYYKHFAKGHWKRCQSKLKCKEEEKKSRKTIDEMFLAIKRRKLNSQNKDVSEVHVVHVTETVSKDTSDTDSSNISSDSENSSSESDSEYESDSSELTTSSLSSDSDDSDETTLKNNPRGHKHWRTLHPTAMKLQQCIEEGLHDEHFFNIFVSSVCDFALKSDKPAMQFAWNPVVKEFVTSLEHIGGKSVVNLISGPGDVNQKKEKRHFNFDWANWNIPLPSETTTRNLKPPAITGKTCLRISLSFEANAAFLCSLDNEVTLLVGNEYTTKGLTGANVYEQMCKFIEIVQICYKCLLKCDDDNGIITLKENTCRSQCEECIAKNKNGDLSPCSECKYSGHMYSHPAIRASDQCFEAGEKCEKLWVAIWTSDCEQIYKSVMEMFENKKTSGTLPIELI